jgi:phage baseplate assembly protein W
MSTIKKYEFKSGGNSIESLKKAEKSASSNNTIKPIGIKTPLSLSNSDDIFTMNYSLFSQIEDNLRNLILTEKGERLCFPNLGTSIKSLMTRNNENIEELIMSNIQSTVSSYMPFVNLLSFISDIDESEKQKGNIVLDMKIGFTVPTLSNEQRQINVRLGLLY